MIGTYPILINGEKAGELNIIGDGMLTRFEAVCEDTGEILRLSVYGECEGYLGVMLPCDGKYRLTKCLSRLALRDFPQAPTHAGECGMGVRAADVVEQETQLESQSSIEREPELLEAPERAFAPIPSPAIAVMAAQNEPMSAEPVSIEPVGDVSPLEETEIDQSDVYIWQRQTGGALTCIKDGVRLLALPHNTPRLPVERIRETRDIEGTKYAIFKIEDGKIL